MLDSILGNPVLVSIGIALIAIVALIFISLGILSMWKKVPQNMAAIITGMKKRVISGGGGLVIPILERADYISLQNMNIEVNVTGLSSTGVDIKVGALTILKVKNDQQSILAAMEQFNRGNPEDTVDVIIETSKEVLEGKLREILSTMTVEELYKNREKFASSVQEVAAAEMADMGLEIKAFTIKEISDDNGYLESLGKYQVAEVKKDASIAESNANKLMEITIANNLKETTVQKAETMKDTAIQLAILEQQKQQAKIAADTQIAEAIRAKEIKTLAYDEEIAIRKAKKDSAYAIECNKVKLDIINSDMAAQLSQESKNAELTEAQTKVQIVKKEQEIKVAVQSALLKQEELGATVQKAAEAEAIKSKTMAEAKAVESKTLADADLYKREKNAEAQKIERTKEAEATAAEIELKGNAETKMMESEGNARAKLVETEGLARAKAVEAEGLSRAKTIEAQGLAEAVVIREKAMAEAEAMQKKAEAYKQYGEAAVTEMIINKLPEITANIAKAIAEPMGRIGQITVIDSGNGENSGANRVSNYAANIMTQLPQMIKATTGIDVLSLLKGVAANIGEVKTSDVNTFENDIIS